jgi:molybdenum cofactor biosynthesis enzyme MoaA
MTRWVRSSSAPARLRVGLPVVPDGSDRHPLLLRLPYDDDGACNNGCATCITAPLHTDASSWQTPVADRHVVIRHREATLRRELPAHIRELRERGPRSITLITNGRMLLYAALARSLIEAGVDRLVVKLFGCDAAEHDAHTRDEGSFDQALRGIRVARALGAEVHVAFPLAEPSGAHDALARELTGTAAVDLAEPQVFTHANEYRYDVVTLRNDEPPFHEDWVRYFPMVHINTGPSCNIRCTYCNVHGGDDQRLYAREDIEPLIDHAVRSVLNKRSNLGRPTVDFIGGEPTLHPELEQLVAYTRDSGFQSISVCTNGFLLVRRRGFLDRLVDAGLTMVRYSFHDHRPDVANALADMPALGDHYPEAGRLLLARKDIHVHLFRIILASNIDALPDYLRWLAAHNQTGRPIDLALGMPSMRGRLFEYTELYPRLDEIRERVASALELAEQLGIAAFIHHAPACLVPDAPGRVSCLNISTLQFDALASTEATMSFEGDARYGRACESCPGKAAGCHGLPAAYWESDSEAAERWLVPVELPDIRAR